MVLKSAICTRPGTLPGIWLANSATLRVSRVQPSSANAGSIGPPKNASPNFFCRSLCQPGLGSSPTPGRFLRYFAYLPTMVFAETHRVALRHHLMPECIARPCAGTDNGNGLVRQSRKTAVWSAPCVIVVPARCVKRMAFEFLNTRYAGQTRRLAGPVPRQTCGRASGHYGRLPATTPIHPQASATQSPRF